jgi:hypothetical protein
MKNMIIDRKDSISKKIMKNSNIATMEMETKIKTKKDGKKYNCPNCV